MTSPGIGWTGPPSFAHSGSPATFWRGCVQVTRVTLSPATVTARTCCGSTHLERGCLAVERVCTSAHVVGQCCEANPKPVNIPTAHKGLWLFQ